MVTEKQDFTDSFSCLHLNAMYEYFVLIVLRLVDCCLQLALVTTIGYQLKGRPAVYALEGSVAIAGAAMTWLRDNLELISNYQVSGSNHVFAADH